MHLIKQRQINPLANPGAVLLTRNSLSGGIQRKLVVERVQVITGFLENSLRIGIEDRVLSTLDQLLVQFIDVGEVEISGHHEIFTGPIAFSKIGMTRSGSVLPGSAVAQMPEKNFTTIIEM